VEPPEGDAQEGAHHHRIELHAGGPDEFPAGGAGIHGLFVGTGRRHHLEGIGDGDDPGAERHLTAAQPTWITAAVPPLVVLSDRQGPFSEPWLQRYRQLLPLERMGLDLRPLAGIEGPRLVEQLGRDGHLADVVEERGPAQPVPGGGRQPELVGEEVGVGAHPLGMSPGDPVVAGQHRHQFQDPAGGLRRVTFEPVALQLFDPKPELPGGGGTERQPEPRGCPVGKRQCEFEERGQGEEPAGQAVADEKRAGDDEEKGDPPGCPLGPRAPAPGAASGPAP
jgi:hypothetical protein